MAAVNLNNVRKTIEQRLITELKEPPIVSVVFHNMPFDMSTVCALSNKFWSIKLFNNGWKSKLYK